MEPVADGDQKINWRSGSFMPKISTLGQKLWPTGREQTDGHTDAHTDRQRKQTLRTPFFEKFFF